MPSGSIAEFATSCEVGCLMVIAVWSCLLINRLYIIILKASLLASLCQLLATLNSYLG